MGPIASGCFWPIESNRRPGAEVVYVCLHACWAPQCIHHDQLVSSFIMPPHRREHSRHHQKRHRSKPRPAPLGAVPTPLPRRPSSARVIVSVASVSPAVISASSAARVPPSAPPPANLRTSLVLAMRGQQPVRTFPSASRRILPPQGSQSPAERAREMPGMTSSRASESAQMLDTLGNVFRSLTVNVSPPSPMITEATVIGHAASSSSAPSAASSSTNGAFRPPEQSLSSQRPGFMDYTASAQPPLATAPTVPPLAQSSDTTVCVYDLRTLSGRLDFNNIMGSRRSRSLTFDLSINANTVYLRLYDDSALSIDLDYDISIGRSGFQSRSTIIQVRLP